MYTPKAPLFRDPVYDGAADPVVIWNHLEKSWFMFYTNRRASAVNIGFSFVHGTAIGVASSDHQGRDWLYRGTLDLEFEAGTNTFWAPEVIFHEGLYHMFVSYVRGIPTDWNDHRRIVHYTSENLWQWEKISTLSLSSNRVIDACVFKIAKGHFKMWYKDEINGSHTWAAISNDLFNWQVTGPEITDCPHEGPNVFRLDGHYWMITDPWRGLGVYKSDDASTWTRQAENILRDPGMRPDDGSIGAHADIVVNNGKAYIFYFTHPQMSEAERSQSDFIWEYQHRRSSIQVATLEVKNGQLCCDRNQVQMELMPE